MKATLEFNLPEETEEYETYMNAGKMSSFIHEMVHGKLRNLTKYEDFSVLYGDYFEEGTLSDNDKEIISKVIHAVRSYIGDQLAEHGLDNF